MIATLACTSACADDDVDPPRLEIIVDDLGVPHVYGATDEDAFYGAGYQMASARLYHMDMTRRGAYGRQAEVLGTDRVEDDELARTFDWPGWGQRHAELMASENPETLALVESWTRGVNARIDEVLAGEAPLPHGFGPDEHDYPPEHWQAQDVLVIATMTGFGNDLSFDREVFATIAYQLAPAALDAVEILRPIRPVFITPVATHVHAPPVPQRRGPALAPADVDRDALDRTMAALRRLRGLQGLGSNNWVVSGEHTEDGRPLIAGDPHLNFDVPGLFYAQHINSKDQGGTIDAAGFSFVGTPGISVGQTDRIVWTPTTAFADVMDVWTVAMPDDGHVSVGGELVEVVRRTEIITVRGAGDAVGEGATQSLEILDVPGIGVILPEDLIPLHLGDPGDRLLLGWTGFRPNPFHGLLDFNRAQSIDEFDEAVLGWSGNFNFVAADADGITYRVGTKVPVRDTADGRTPHLVQDGDDARTMWTDARLPPEQLPHGRGEGRGFVATANNDPFGFLADGRIDGDPWYFGAFFDPGWRAARIESELQRRIDEGPLALEDVQALQTDVHDSIADDLVPLVVDAWSRRNDDPALADLAARAELGTLVELLEGWDRDMRRDSSAALVMHAWSYFVAARGHGGARRLRDGRRRRAGGPRRGPAARTRRRRRSPARSLRHGGPLGLSIVRRALHRSRRRARGGPRSRPRRDRRRHQHDRRRRRLVVLRSRRRRARGVGLTPRSDLPHDRPIRRRRHAGDLLRIPARQRRGPEQSPRARPARRVDRGQLPPDAIPEVRNRSRRRAALPAARRRRRVTLDQAGMMQMPT
jgi:penicillin amidase